MTAALVVTVLALIGVLLVTATIGARDWWRQ